MEELNNFIYNTFKLIHESQNQGVIQKPLTLKIFRKDKKVLKNIYDIYKIYRYGLTKKDFFNICRDYSVNSGFNIIKAGSEMAQLLEKITNE